MSVIASTDLHNNNDDVLFDKKTFEKLKDMDIENLEYENSEEENDEENEIMKDGHSGIVVNGRHYKYDNDGDEKKADDDDEDDSEDEGVKRVEKMADDIDAYYSN